VINRSRFLAAGLGLCFSCIAGTLIIPADPYEPAYVVGGPVAVDARCLDLMAWPLKAAYVPGEPMAIQVVLKNASLETISVDVDSPVSHPLIFRCGEQGARERSPEKRPLSFSFSINHRDIEPGAEYKFLGFLNPYLELKSGREYTVYCSALYDGLKGSVPAEFCCGCRISVKIAAGESKPENWRWLLERWDGKDGQVAKEVFAVLSCIEDPAVIPFFVKFARELPECSWMAALGMRRFAKTPEGRVGLEKMAEEYKGERDKAALLLEPNAMYWGSDVIGNVLRVLLSTGEAPSQEFIRVQLKSKNDYRNKEMLSFLSMQSCRWKPPLDAVELLCKAQDEEISRLAKEVMEKYTPATPENPGQF